MKISVSVGRTVNMGNYESARIDVGMEMDCEPKNRAKTYQEMKCWCDEQVAVEMELLMNEKPNVRR